MSTPTILIVEDERLIALDIKHRLNRLGYSVVAIADSAENALEAVVQHQPDLVLMDIYLNGDTSGIEAAASFQREYQLPVVFLTAHADRPTLIQAKAIRPFGYIVKPVEDHDLSTAIEIALSRYQAEIAMQNALKQEQELNQLKSQFISIISHEFRNPLNSILSTLNLLERQDLQLSREQQLPHVQRAMAAAIQLTQLIDDVLILGETETARFQCHPAPLDLLWFCRNLIEEVHSDPGCQHSILLNVEGCQENEQPFYNLDIKLVRHILSNLLSNAIKYSPDGGEVKLTICGKPRSITFCVQDKGIGIPVEDQYYLFDPFHRGTNTSKIQGTGLGLSIVKRCVDAHGGSISVESQIRVGTTFTVTIPLDNADKSNDQNGRRKPT